MTVGELIEQLSKFNPEDKIQIKYKEHYMGAEYDIYKWADKIFHRNAVGQSTIVIEIEEDRD